MEFSYTPPENFRNGFDYLHELVAAEIGSSDFGPDDYVPGLITLLQSMDYDPSFSEQGRRAAWGEVVGALKGRAHAFKAMRENPGFSENIINSPVVITGVPRTGTTALHRMMAADQRFQALQSWLLDSPMPRPPREQWAAYPEFQKTVARLAAQNAAVPGQSAAHYLAAEEVHECCMLLRQSFVCNIWSCAWSAASYDAWWQCQSEANGYDYYSRCVQLIGSSAPEKRWLLKNPGHIEHLDLLFAVFPDARVIQTHRDPAKAVPSLVALLMLLYPVMEQGRAGQRAEITLRREVAKWANAVRKAEQVRRKFPDQVLDVRHHDFHRDPMGELERIYRFIGMEITEDLHEDFSQRIAEKPELSRGEHRYSIGDYGMTEAAAREPFGDYIEKFGLVAAG